MGELRPLAEIVALPTPEANGTGVTRNGLTWKNLSEIEAKPILFLDKPVWQQSAFHLLVGRKNAGKGTLLSAEAARVTRGELGEKRQVVWIAVGEDSYAIDVRPRIEVAGGDVSKVTVLHKGVLTLPNNVNDLMHMCREIGDVGMIVIDPLGGTLGRGKSTNFDGDVRPALTALNTLADRLGCLVTGVRHLTNKEISGSALAAVLGASDWVNVPRVVLALVHDREDSDLRHLTVLTGNRVRANTGRLYRIEGVPSPVAEGDDVTLAVLLGESNQDAEDLLATNPDRQESKSRRAKDVMLDALEAADGHEMESDTLDALVIKETGMAVQSVRNLRVKLKNDGLIRAIPDRGEDGEKVVRWLVRRTGAPR